MRKGINLAHGKKQTDNLLRKASVISITLFSLSVVISLLLLAYRLYLNTSYNSIVSKGEVVSSQVLSFREKKDKLIETKSRLADIRKIINKRATVVAKVDSVTQVLTPQSELSGINASSEEVEVSVESVNLSSMNDLIEEKIISLTKDKKKGIQRIEIRSFGLNTKTLKYRMTFGVIFK